MQAFQFQRFRMVARQELRLLLKERSLWWVGGLFLLLIGYALFNGVLQTTQRDSAQAALVAADAQARAGQLAQLQRIMAGTETPTPFGNPANPANMAGGLGAHYAVMPSAALAPVALGQTDLFPSQFKVTHQSKVNFLHNNDIENPWHLLSGHFDLAFVVVYLLPLLIFALSYNLLSGEKEDGTLRLLLSQPLALPTLIAGKIAVRAAVLLGAAVLVPLAVLLVARPHALAMPGATLWWALVVGAYALFWFTAVVAVNAFGRSSATNAMVLIIGWVVLVLVVPVLLNIAVTHISPAPSRAELATRTRVVTAQAMSQNAALLATDYEHVDKPDVLVPKDGRLAMSGRAMANYRIQRQVDDTLQPELDRFDAQQAQQQALVARWSAVSPAAVAYEGITALAGTGHSRNAWFMAQITAYHQAWKDFFFPRIDGGLAITEADFAHIPAFAWRDEAPGTVQAQAARAVLQLLLPTLVLLGVALWRLRRYRVV
ncbi:ABC transporter permease subunit [Acidovorax sp. sic0104]|uniref:ABC transporter permease subunit n=1 Tax=Acidovorax sp. sic0104 TaxID=2854784 RepID=UPI001C497889|nr:ABC transporter permease subunit [Acidovorax sp. sic0104]